MKYLPLDIRETTGHTKLGKAKTASAKIRIDEEMC
jgi:hypothetical protein